MTYLQALDKLIEHLEQRENRNVVDIQLDELKSGMWKFFVSFDDIYEKQLEVVYVIDKEVKQ